MKKPLVLILAAGALAVGVPTAFAATGGDNGSQTPAATQTQTQPAQQGGDHPCPEHDGSGGTAPGGDSGPAPSGNGDTSQSL